MFQRCAFSCFYENGVSKITCWRLKIFQLSRGEVPGYFTFIRLADIGEYGSCAIFGEQKSPAEARHSV
jgi:hypothetical protein